MLRVRVEIVPYGREDQIEEIACIDVGRDNPDRVTDRTRSRYRVTDHNSGDTIGYFALHRYGWYRNRLGLAARALKMLQLRRNAGRHLPPQAPFGIKEPY